MMKKFICFSCGLLVYLAAYTQKGLVPEKKLSLGIGLQNHVYNGDLNPQGFQAFEFLPTANLFLEYQNTSFLGFQLNLGHGRFQAERRLEELIQTPSAIPNTFVASQFAYSDGRIKFQSSFGPYCSIGAGMMYFEAKSKEGRHLRDVIESRSSGESYPNFVSFFPLSIGTQLKFGSRFFGRLEYTFRFIGSDHLDNIGLLGPEHGNDRLHGFQVNLGYRIPQGQKDEKSNVVKKPKQDLLSSKEIRSARKWNKEVKISKKDKDLLTKRAQKDLQSQKLAHFPKTTQVRREKTIAEIAPKGFLVDGQELIRKEKEALHYKRFLMYKVKGEKDLVELSQLYKVRLETLLRINFKKNRTLIEGEMIRIPKLKN